jgi:hypothetical protein
MQVLLNRSETHNDIQCGVCNQSFRLYWERTSESERDTMRAIISKELLRHHEAELGNDKTVAAHPVGPFNLPDWSGAPQFSGAALLGGLADADRFARKPDSLLD